MEVNRIIQDKKKYHINCHDCGRFLKKDRWVLKNHRWKKHGLCEECLSGYDEVY